MSMVGTRIESTSDVLQRAKERRRDARKEPKGGMGGWKVGRGMHKWGGEGKER